MSTLFKISMLTGRFESKNTSDFIKFMHASEFNNLLQQFIKSVDPDRFIFAMFLAQIRKHNTLALFSALRLHHIQAMMDLRQELEAGSCAAYSIANPDVKGFADIDENGIADASQELAKKRYKWLEDNFKQGSDAIKNMKEAITQVFYHTLTFNNSEPRYRVDIRRIKVSHDGAAVVDLNSIGTNFEVDKAYVVEYKGLRYAILLNFENANTQVTCLGSS